MTFETSPMPGAGLRPSYTGADTGTRAPSRGRVSTSKALIPLSQAQLCFWVIYANVGETANVVAYLEIEGRLDVSRLERAFQLMIQRHDVLRMRIESGKPMQQAVDDAPFDLTIRSLDHLDPDESLKVQAELALKMQGIRFDLSAPPLLRAELLKLEENRHRLLLCFPHIAADGGATALFQRQLFEIYKNLGSHKAVPGRNSVLQIGDHALAERAQLEGTEAAEDFWRSQLEGYPHATWPVRYLSLDNAVTRVVHLPLPEQLMQSWVSAMHRHRATLQMCILSSVGMAVAEVTGQAKFSLNSVLENRASPETETMMGPMLRIMPVPINLGQKPDFEGTLKAVRAQVIAAYEHMNVSWSFPLGLLAKQRWEGTAPRSLIWLVGRISALYARMTRKARLHSRFLSDYLFMEPRPPRSFFAALSGRRNGSRAPLLSPSINVNMLQAVFRPADTFRRDPADDTTLTVRDTAIPERAANATGAVEPAAQWEDDTINCYVVDSPQGRPSLRIETSCLNAEGMKIFIAALRRALDAGD